MGTNRDSFETDLYDWEFNHVDNTYIWKTESFKVETTYYKNINKIKIIIFSINNKIQTYSENIINNPTIESIRRASQRVLSEKLDRW